MKVIHEWAGPCQGGVRALGCWGAGPLTAVVAGVGAVQSSIRARGRVQGVVRGSGAQSRQGDGPLAESFERIAERRGRQIAKVAVARKILTLCFYGLRDGEIRCLNAPDRASAMKVMAA